DYAALVANPDFATVGSVNNPNPAILPSVPTTNTYAGHPYITNLDIINWLLNNMQVSATTYTAHVDMSTDPGHNTPSTAEDVPNVPYYTVSGLGNELFTYGDIQESMYELLGDGLLSGNPYMGTYDANRVADIVNQAVTHDGFVPLAGQKLVEVLDVLRITN